MSPAPQSSDVPEPATATFEGLEEPLQVGAILRRSAPRVVRDALGPLVCFFIGWKLVGLVAGIGLATLFALVIFRHERRSGRPAMVVRVALGLVLIRAVVGLASGSAKVYLGQEVAIDATLALIVLGSVARGRPLAGFFVKEVFTFPEEVRGSETYTRTLRQVTLVWGFYFLARSAVRLTALVTLSVDQYLLVAALSGAPFLVGLLAWSIFHTARAFRRSAEWGAAFAAAEAEAVEVASEL